MNGIQKQNSLLIKSKKISKNKLKLNKLKQKNEKYNFGGIISLQIFLGLSVHFHSNSINIFLIDNFSFGDFLFLMTLIVPLIFILYFFYRAMKFSNIINKHINKMPNEKILYEENIY